MQFGKITTRIHVTGRKHLEQTKSRMRVAIKERENHFHEHAHTRMCTHAPLQPCVITEILGSSILGFDY